jgi:phosphatidyl-myo-inositol dimannoside synthase
MKLLLTLDFPPEKGGIQRYLSGIVRHTFTASDLVLVGCGRIEPTYAPVGPATILRVTTPFSQWNKKFSCIPLFCRFIALKITRRDSMEVLCGNVYAASVAWVASLFFKNITYGVYTYGTELLKLQERSLTGWVLGRVLKKANVFYALGEFTAKLLLEAGISARPIMVPPRIELPAVTPDAGVFAGAGGQTMHILSVGRLVRHKGHAVLIEALSLLPPTVQWRCVIAGDGPLRQDLSDLAREKKIHDRLQLKTGLTDDALWQEFHNASVFVLPSLPDNGAEGFGIVLLEAMARGVPVIAGKTGGVPEVLEYGACGLLVQPGDAAAFAEAIALIHRDTVLRRRLAAQALRRVKDCYAW